MPTTNCGPTDIAGVCASHNGGETWMNLTPIDFRIGYLDPLLYIRFTGTFCLSPVLRPVRAFGESCTRPPRASHAAGMRVKAGMF